MARTPEEDEETGANVAITRTEREEIDRQLREALSPAPQDRHNWPEPEAEPEADEDAPEEEAFFPEAKPLIADDAHGRMMEIRRRAEIRFRRQGKSVSESRELADEVYDNLRWLDPGDMGQIEAHEARGETWDSWSDALRRAVLPGVVEITEPLPPAEQPPSAQEPYAVALPRGIRPGLERPEHRGVFRRQLEVVSEEVTEDDLIRLYESHLRGGPGQVWSDLWESEGRAPVGLAEYQPDLVLRRLGLLVEPGAHVVGDHPTRSYRVFIEPMDIGHKAERVAEAQRGEIHPAVALREYEAWRKDHRHVADEYGYIPPRDNELQRQYNALVHLAEMKDLSDDEIYQAMADIPADAIPDAITRAAILSWDPDRSPRLQQIVESEPIEVVHEFLEGLVSPITELLPYTPIGRHLPGPEIRETYIERVAAEIKPVSAVVSELYNLGDWAFPGDLFDLGVLEDLEQTPLQEQWNLFASRAEDPEDAFESAEDRREELTELLMSVGRVDFPPEVEVPTFTLSQMLQMTELSNPEDWSPRFRSTYEHTYERLLGMSGASDLPPGEQPEAVAEWVRAAEAGELVTSQRLPWWREFGSLGKEFNTLALNELPKEIFSLVDYGSVDNFLDAAIAGARRYGRRHFRVKGDFPQRTMEALEGAMTKEELVGERLYRRETMPGYLLRVVPGVTSEPIITTAGEALSGWFMVGDALGIWDYNAPRRGTPGRRNLLLKILDNIGIEGRPGVMMKIQDMAVAFGHRPGSSGYRFASSIGAFGEFLSWEKAQFTPARIALRARRLRGLMPSANVAERWSTAAIPEREWRRMDVRNPLTGEPVEYPGFHALVGEKAVRVWDENFAIDADIEGTIGPNTMGDIREVLRKGGVDPSEVAAEVRARGGEAAQEYIRNIAGIVKDVDEFTLLIRDLPEYAAVNAQIRRLDAAGLLKGKRRGRGLNLVEDSIRFVEMIAMASARTKGIEGARSVLAQFLEGTGAVSWADVTRVAPEGRLVRPAGGRRATADGGSPLEIEIAAALARGVGDEVDADAVRAAIDSLDDKANAPVLNADGRVVDVAPGSAADVNSFNLSGLSAEELTRLSLFSENPELMKAAHEELRYRVGSEHIDGSTATRDASVGAVSEILEPLADSYRSVFDEAASIAESVRAAVEGAPGVPARGAVLFGREQIKDALRAHRESGGLDEAGYLILSAWIDTLPEEVLAGLRLDELIRMAAPGEAASARFTGMTVEDAAQRVHGAIQFFATDAAEPAAMRSLEPPEWRGLSFEEILVSVGVDPTVGPVEAGVRSKVRRAAILRVHDGTETVDSAAKLLIDWEIEVHRAAGRAKEAAALSSPEAYAGLTVGIERDLLSAARSMKRVGERVYYFLHELGHGILHTFLSDAEVERLARAFIEEQREFGLLRDTPYARSHDIAGSDAFHEWFAENFAEYVISHKMPEKLADLADTPALRRIFDAVIERLSDFFQTWFQRNARWAEEFNPAFRDVVDRLIDGKAEEISTAKEVYSRRFRGARPMFVRGVSDVGVAADAGAETFRVAITGATEKLHEVRRLVVLWREAHDSLIRASNPEIRAERLQAFNDMDARLQAAVLPALEESLLGGLPLDVMRIRNARPGGFEQSIGRFGTDPVEAGFYLEIDGPREIVLGRLSAASDRLHQDGLLIRRVIEEVSVEALKAGDEELSFAKLVRTDADGLDRAATLTVDLPPDFSLRAMKDLRGVIADLWVGATIREGVGVEGNIRLELAHTPEWSGQSADDFLATMFERMIPKLDAITKKRNIGSPSYKWAHEEVLVVGSSPSRVEADGVFHGNIAGYEELIRAGRDAEELIGGVAGDVRSDEGVLRGLQEAGERRPRGGEAAGEEGGPRVAVEREPVAGGREPRGPDDSSVYGSLPLSRRIAGEFLPQDEVVGGSPHGIVDVDIEAQLQGRVDRGEISERQRDYLVERFGKASPLEDISRDLSLTIDVDGIDAPVSYVAKVAPLTKDGFRVDIPGGIDKPVSFADANYIARRPIELVEDDLRLPLPDEVDELLKARISEKEAELGRALTSDEDLGLRRDLIANYDDAFELYVQEYFDVVEGLYDKLYASYGTEPFRPNPAKYFDEDGNLIPETAHEWRELMEITLLDIASQFAFAVTSKQTNLLDNQIFAAVTRPRSIDEMRSIVNRFNLWEGRKGSPVSEGESRHLLGLAPTVSESTMKKLFRGRSGLIDIEKEIIPLLGDTVELRNYDLPSAPIMKVLLTDVLTANARKIGPRARAAATRLRAAKDRVASARGKLGRRREALAKYEKQLSEARTAKQRSEATRKADNAREAIERYEGQIRDGLLTIRRNRRALQRAETGVKVEATALTEDPVYTSPTPARDLLSVYRSMLNDFDAVMSGEQKYSWFEHHPDEGWVDTVARLSGTVPGLATKVTIFGLVWQNPAKATVGAVDIHIFRKYAPELLVKHHYDTVVRWLDDWKRADTKPDTDAFEAAAKSQLTDKKARGLRRSLGREPSATERGAIVVSDAEVKPLVERLRAQAVKDRVDYDIEMFLRNTEDNPARSFWTERGQSLLLEPNKIRVMPTSALPTKRIFVGDGGAYEPRIDSGLMAQVLAAAEERAAKSKLVLVDAEEAVRRAEGAPLRDPSERSVVLEAAEAGLEKALNDVTTRTTAVEAAKKAVEAHRLIEEWTRVYGADSPEIIRLHKRIESGDPEQSVIHEMSADYERILNIVRKEAAEKGVSAFQRQHVVWDIWRGYMDPHMIAYPGTAMLPGMKSASWNALWGSFKEAGYGGSPTFRGRPHVSSLAEAPEGRLSAGFYARHPDDPKSPLRDIDDFRDALDQVDDFFVSGNTEALFARGEQILRGVLGEDHPDAMALLHKHFDTVETPTGGRALSPEGVVEASDAFRAYWMRKRAPTADLLFWFEQIHLGLGEFWRRLRSRSDILPDDIKRMYDEAFRFWDDVDHEAKNLVMVTREERQASFPSVRVEVESALDPGAAGQKMIRAGKAREFGRINMERGRVRKALGLAENVSEADPVELFRNALRYVVTEYTRNSIADAAVAITRRSIVPRSLVNKINERVNRRFATAHGPVEEFSKQLVRQEVVHPETGAQVFNEITGRPEILEVYELTKDQQFHVRFLVNELALDPVAGPAVPRTLLDPRNDLSQISVWEYNALKDAARDAESGISAGRSRYAEKVPKSLGYEVVDALIRGMEKIGAKKIVDGIRRDFVVPRAMGKKLDPKTGQMVAAPEKVPAAGAHVVETVETVLQEVFATDEWALRVISNLKKENPKMGMAELVDGLHRTLSPVLDPITYGRLSEFRVMFSADAPLKIIQLSRWIDEIQAAFTQGRYRLSDVERQALINIKKLVEDWDGKRALTKPEKRLLEAAKRDIDIGVGTRLDAADMQLRNILVGLGGSRDRDLSNFVMGMERPEVRIRFYRAFYEGRWSDLFKYTELRGFEASGLRFNQDYAKLEMILRLHALNRWGDLAENMAAHGLKIRVADITNGLNRNLDSALYTQRVIHYLNVMTNFGGMAVYERMFGASVKQPPGFAPGKFDFGREVVGAEPGSELYPPSEQRGGAVHSFRDDEGRLHVHDMQAYTQARSIMDEWGFRVGGGTWSEITLPKTDALGASSGERVILPDMLLGEIEPSISRVAGEGVAYGAPRPTMDPGYGPAPSTKEVSVGAIQSGIDTLLGSVSYNRIYSNIRMGVTGGIFMPNVPYYTGVALGSYVQIYMHMGLRGLWSAFRHPMIAGDLVGRLWGKSGKRLHADHGPFITGAGDIYTVSMLERLAMRESLNSSFLRSETARLLAEDIQRMSGGFWNDMMAFPRKWQGTLVEVSTAIDNFYRINVFMSELDAGKSVTAAAAAARAALFDYGALTPFEKKGMRNIVMFYSYMRKNLDLFWDTLLTNPHRIMGQARLMNGILAEHIEDAELAIPEYDVGRIPLFIRDVMVNDHVRQKEVTWLPLLSITDVVQLGGDLLNAASALPGGGVVQGQDMLGLLARLNPMIGAVEALAFDKDLLKGRPLGDEAVPAWFAEWDLAMTGGMILIDFLDAAYEPVSERQRLDYPGQTHIWIARSKNNYWLWRNLFHVGPLGGRGVGIVESVDRSGLGPTELVVSLAWRYHDLMVRMGYKEEVDIPFMERREELAEPREGMSPFGELRSALGFKTRVVYSPEELRQRAARELERDLRETEKTYEPR